MSGIAGIFHLDGRPVDPKLLTRMTDVIAYRGPDGSGIWAEGSVGFGHRMLWTTPESLYERLPFTDPTGSFTITADARIDNRHELLSALSMTYRRSDWVSDSEIILAAYEKWGERCVERLLGDFAFAIWDQRRGTLFCARDHFGVKPFYYYRTNSIFVFASEIKALLCLPEVPRRLNEVRVADYIFDLTEDEVITFYQEIFRLPAAHSVVVSGMRLSQRRYWSLDANREIHYASNAEYIEAFREVFTEAIRCRLRSAGPVGSMLSGGLDSSSIVCIAREIIKEDGSGNFHTFSARNEHASICVESPYIDAVLRMGGLQSQTIHSSEVETYFTDLEHVLRCQDEPFDAATLFIPRMAYSAARRKGISVILDGVDGDLLASLRRTYLAYLIRAGQWRECAEEIAGLSSYMQHPRWRIFFGYGILPLMPPAVQKAYSRLRSGETHLIWGDERLINPTFARRVGLMDRLEALQGDDWRLAQTLREEHLRRLTWGHIPFALEAYERAAAMFSIEPRHPFFDKRLAEFCLSLPADQKVHRGWTKIVLRRAMTDYLPWEVQWRRDKANLSGTFINALAPFMEGYVREMLLKRVDIIRGYVNVSVLQLAYQRCLAQGNHADAVTLWWETTVLADWLHRVGFSSVVTAQ